MLSVLPFMAITRRCWFGCPLGFCPLVSFCEENDALHFQVIHCPTNISVLQSIQQLLLISSPCRNPYLLFHIVYLLIELILLHPSAGHLHDILGSVLSKFPSTGMCISFDLHPLQSLLFINWMVVSLLHLCNRSQRMVNYSWRSFHLMAASVVRSPPSRLPDPSRSSSLQKDLLPIMNLRSGFKKGRNSNILGSISMINMRSMSRWSTPQLSFLFLKV